MEKNNLVNLLAQSTVLDFSLIYQPEFAFAQGDATVPIQSMFGSVVPYQTRCDYSLSTTCMYSRYNVNSGDPVLIDKRLLEAGAMGIPPIYWPDLDFALKLGLKPFKPSRFSPDQHLYFTWVEVAQRSIAYIGECFQPPLAPVCLKHINYNKWMYIAKLATFWQTISHEYITASWDDGAGVSVVDLVNPAQGFKGALGLAK